jgi:HAD superfamily hydrolase (TIGR01509 family)
MLFAQGLLLMKHYNAILFDYGNTLVEFSTAQVEYNDRALHRALEQRFGHCDYARLAALRARDRRAPYVGSPCEYREGDFDGITRGIVRELYERDAEPADVEALTTLRRETFVESVIAPDYLHAFLGRLAAQYTLGLVSNYICGHAIRRSLDRLGLAAYFTRVIVSADLGYVKPHALLFKTIVQELGLDPPKILFVGDNWLADVQGAKRAGMDACLTRQFFSHEIFEPQAGDFDPDYTIDHLLELEALLPVCAR